MKNTNDLAIHAFAHTAQGFCTWCEAACLDAGPTPENMTTAARWLSQLYAAALALPKVSEENFNGPPEDNSPERIRAKHNLGKWSGYYYRDFFDPDPTLDDAYGLGDIGDDMLDTYNDVKNGSILFEQGNIHEALWYWQFQHCNHWGRHAVGALLAMHCDIISKQSL